MNNNTPNNGIWPEHDAQVYERALKYQVYLEYGVSKEDVHKYGLLSYCIRGFKIKEIYDYLVDVGQFVIGKIDRMKPYIWMGGCGPKHKSSLDFKLPIPSQDIKDNGTFYTVYTKAENDSTDEFYMREAEVGKEVTHECPSFGFHTNIQRFSSCKHTIAAVLILKNALLIGVMNRKRNSIMV